MNTKHNKSIFFLGSSFFFFTPIPAHYIFFMLALLSLTYKLIQSRISKKNFVLLVTLGLTISLLTSSHIANIATSKWENFIKFIIITPLMMLLAIDNSRQTEKNTGIPIKTIKYIYLVIIGLNFAQAVSAVAELNLWLTPFQEEKNSRTAYAIEQATILIGSANKNIWASKVLIFSIPLIYFIYKDTADKENRIGELYKIITLGMLSFILLYTQSRAAQVCLIILLTPLGYAYYKKIKSLLAKFTLATIGLAGFIFFLMLFFKKFFYINLDYGDGFFSRTLLWRLALDLIPKSPYLGHGFESGSIYIHETGLDAQNFHNVLINSLMDFGIIGGILFIATTATIVLKVISQNIDHTPAKLATILTLAAVFSVQYYGYDPELIFLIYPLIYVTRKNAS